MNPNNRTNVRNSSTFPRIGNSHQNRHGHHSRWHVNHLPFAKDFQQGYSQGYVLVKSFSLLTSLCFEFDVLYVFFC